MKRPVWALLDGLQPVQAALAFFDIGIMFNARLIMVQMPWRQFNVFRNIPTMTRVRLLPKLNCFNTCPFSQRATIGCRIQIVI